MGRREKVKLHKWQIKFDGTGKDMSIDSFIFRVERLAEQHGVNHEKLLADFHCLLSGTAARWYWQLLEDNKNNPSLDYVDVKKAMISHFKSSQTDVEIIKEQPGESFEDYYTAMHNLSFGLQKKLSERELVDIIKGNLKGQLATMLFSCTIFTLADLKRECLRAEKVLRDSKPKQKQVNELSTDFDISDFEISFSNLSIDAMNTSQTHKNSAKISNQGQGPNQQSKTDFRGSNAASSSTKPAASYSNKPPVRNTLCASPFHLNLCYNCGMPVDYYSKNSVSEENICKSPFHKMKCFMCDKAISYMCSGNTDVVNVK